MPDIHLSRKLMLVCCLLGIQGCGVFRNPVDIPADGLRAIRRERIVSVTLMGGAQLNPGRGGVPRPIQVCIYLVADENWQPGSWLDEKKCRGTSLDSGLFARESRLLSSEHAQQVSLRMPSDKDGWVLIDPDFGSRAAPGYAPLKLKTNSGEFSFHFVVVNGTQVVDGMKEQGAPPRQKR